MRKIVQTKIEKKTGLEADLCFCKPHVPQEADYKKDRAHAGISYLK